MRYFVAGRDTLFAKFASAATWWTGTTSAFMLAFATIIIWIVSGPLFGFSDTWQLVINTGTTIVTFLMVFLIQRSQNKDSQAVHLKLNEIVAALEGASNRLIGAEDLSEVELKQLHEFYAQLIRRAKEEHDICKSHSVEEADDNHEEKLEVWQKQQNNEADLPERQTIRCDQ